MIKTCQAPKEHSEELCEEPVPPHRRKYCSDVCRKRNAWRSWYRAGGQQIKAQKLKEDYKKNTEKYRQYQRRHKYGLEPDEFTKMLVNQNNKCANKNCGFLFTDEQRSTRPVVDHDHKTGNVRGLLCQKCNKALGHLGDTRKSLEGFIDYLGGYGVLWKDE